MDAEVFTIKLIKKFLEKGNRFFTYNSIRHFYYKERMWKDAKKKYEWHTIERSIRRLVNIGVLRKYGKKKAVFFLDENRAREYLLDKMYQYLDTMTLPDGRVIVKLLDGRKKILRSKEELKELIGNL